MGYPVGKRNNPTLLAYNDKYIKLPHQYNENFALNNNQMYIVPCDYLYRKKKTFLSYDLFAFTLFTLFLSCWSSSFSILSFFESLSQLRTFYLSTIGCSLNIVFFPFKCFFWMMFFWTLPSSAVHRIAFWGNKRELQGKGHFKHWYTGCS